ncbi:hypothetical protein A9Q87_01395 [Flavobacteriales bacterium 34_180_T64]|nr:hypothetical protein A9Q87_01395 [Flavobacteriales bacterium 34_180_T64]
MNCHSQVLLSVIFGDKLNSEGLEFGLEGAMNWSNISTLDANKSLSSFNLGFYFDFKLKNQWNVYTGVLVKSKLGADELTTRDLNLLGIELQDEDGIYSQKINYFVVPILLKYNFKNRIYFEAGPQLSLMHNAWVEFNSNEDHRKIRIRDINKDQINTIDAGVAIGTGYKLMADTSMTIGLRYYLGLTNVYKEISGSNNSSLFLKLNIPIGAAKAKENAPTQ